VKERLTLEKTAVGFYLSGHLFDEVAHEVRRFCKRPIDDLLDSRDQQVIAGIVSDFRVINGQRGRLAIFKLDDKSDSIEATADEAVHQRQPQHAQGRRTRHRAAGCSPARGGFEARFQVQQVWDLATARCRFGKFLRVAVNGKAPDIARLVKEFPPRIEQTEAGELRNGLAGASGAGARCGAQVELQLGERAKFFPTDAALASWTAQAEAGKAAVIYD
jgi:DNA polymerase-3 subunit alpha